MSDPDARTLADVDLAAIKAIISEEIETSSPKPTSYWPVVLSVIGATVAVIGTLGPLMIYAVGKDQETRVAMLDSIKESVAGVKDSVAQNTQEISGLRSDIGGLKVTFAKLDGSFEKLDINFERLDENFEKLDDNFQGLLEEIKGKP